jgi:hypothetical protein
MDGRVVLLERPYPEGAIEVMHTEKADIAAAWELASIPLLSASWRKALAGRAETVIPDAAQRLIGANGQRRSSRSA